MESKSEKWQLKRIGTMSFINDECDNLKQSDKAFFENIIRDIFSDVITDFKELEQTIENMKAIAGEKIDFVGTKTSVDLIDDSTTESLKSIPNDFCIEMYICSKCSAEIQEYYTFCPNCGRKIIKK